MYCSYYLYIKLEKINITGERETTSNGRRKSGARKSFPITILYEKENQVRLRKNKNDGGIGAKVLAVIGGRGGGGGVGGGGGGK